MSDPTGPTPSYSGGAIGRMLAVHKEEAVVARDRTPAFTRAFDRALRRSGGAFKGLNLTPGSIRISEHVPLTEGLDGLPETGLVAALEDRDGRRGLLAIGHGMVDALIEIQTTGRVEPKPLPPRPVTRIDEALSRDFLDLTLAAWTHETRDFEERDWPERMNYGSAIPDRRQLPLLMPEQPYHLLFATVSVGEENPREGQVMMLLPCTGPSRAPVTSLAQAPGPDEALPQSEEWKIALEAAMQEAELHLDAVLLRTRRSLREVETLAPGDLIPFGPSDLAAVRLETPAGRHVVTGRLGQIGGMRALRVTAPVGTSPVEPAALPAAGAMGSALDAAGFGAATPEGAGAFGAAEPGGFGAGYGAMGGPADGPPDFDPDPGEGGFPGAPEVGLPGGPAPLADMPGMDPPGANDLPAFPAAGLGGPGPAPLPDLPDPAGGLDPLPMATPAPMDFAPQSAPLDLDNLPE